MKIGTSNYERKEKWAYALQLFKEHPIIGSGVSSTGTHSEDSIIIESGVLKRLVETGIVGTFIYYSMFIIAIITNLRRCMQNPKAQYYMLSIGVIIAIFVENIILQICESAGIFLIFMIFFSILEMGTKKQEEKLKE